MAELPQPWLTVILQPDPLISGDTLVAVGGGASDSTYTLAAPCAGRPEWQQTATGTSPTLGTRGPDLRPVTTGTQETGQAIVVSRAGMPGESLDVVAGLRENGDYVFYGWSQPQVIEHVGAAILDKGQDGVHNTDGVETDDGYALFVWSTNTQIRCRRWDTKSHAWAASAVTIADDTVFVTSDSAAPNIAPVCGVVRLRSGRLLVVGVGRVVGADLSLISYWSDDHGLTWRSASLQAVDTAIGSLLTPTGLALGYDRVRDTALVILTVPYGDGQTPTPGWAQYASSDAGASWSLVEWYGDGAPAGPDPSPPKILADPRAGGYTIASVETSAGDSLVLRRLGSPYLPISEADVETLITLGTAASAPKWVSGWSDAQGVLWYAAASTSSSSIRLTASRDGGATWRLVETYPYADPVGLPTRCVCAPVRDQVVWAATDTARTAWTAQQLLIWESGGWQQLCQPRVAGDYPHELRAWLVDWVPWELPTLLGWTLAGTAGTLATSGAPALTLPASTQSQYYRTLSGAATLALGVICHAEVSEFAGSVDARLTYLRVRVGTADVEARLSPTKIRLWDNVAAAAIGSDHTLSGGSGHRYHVRIAVQGLRAALHVRRNDQRTWHLVAYGAIGVAGAATYRIDWGHATPGGATWGTSKWHRISYTEDAGYGALDAVTDTPASGRLLEGAWQSLPGALLPDPSARLPLFEGLYVHAAGGPGLRGERWTIAVDDRHAADHVTTRPIVERWESAGTTAQRIVWAPAGTLAHHPGGHSVGLALFGCNFREAALEGWTGAAWVTVAQLDLGLTGLAYTRSGDTIRAAVGGTARPLQRWQDLRGATVILDGTYRRVIADAVGGTWSAGASATATLRLEGVTGAEPVSGTATILLTQGAAVRLGHVTGYSRWSIYIPSQSTVSGTFRIGRAVIGTAHVLGQRPSYGRVETREVQGETVQVPGLTRSRRLAPTRRRWRVSWVEGVVSRRGLAAPSYTAAGGAAQVVAGDLSAIDALTEVAGGGLSQLVYLPRVDHTQGAASAETVLCLGRDRCALVTLQGTPQTEQVWGQEAGHEVVRVSEIELEEEP